MKSFLTLILNRSLSSNYVSTSKVSIPEGLFNGLFNVSELNLGDLNIHSIPENAFDGLNSLNTLSLQLKNADSSKISSRLFEPISSSLATL